MDVMPQFHPQYVTDNEGNKKAVILPIEEYEELLEDLEDLAVAAERKDESTITHEQLLRELNKDGLLPD
jgi:PHD/YefM family antitoxin component YafN of YafNO toxin-antitoxin module